MFFTGKGDDGTTSFFGSARRYSKDSPLAWALGTVDEINSFLGICKAKSRGEKSFVILDDAERAVAEILEEVQQTLFIIQGELAGANMAVGEEKVQGMEKIISAIEKELPPIKNFLVSGATEVSACFDYARTLARRAERTVVSLPDDQKPAAHTLAYLNRLSSLLYALARLSAHASGAEEQKPNYK